MLSKARFILSKKKAIEKYNEIKKLSDFVSYSFKTNMDVGLVLEKETDCFFSVHTIDDFKRLNNKSAERVWFFSQAWNFEELNILFSKNVNKFVVDNEVDLKILLDYIEKKNEKEKNEVNNIKKDNKKIWLLLRMKLKENTIHTGKHFVYGLISSKINELLPILKKNKNIEKLGIHFHRKTQNVSEWDLKDELIDSIKNENWQFIDFVNIGGGLPAEYKNYNMSILENIKKKIIDLKNWLNNRNIKMIIEPGRFISAPAVKLEANIKSIYDNNIIIDCSVYNAAMDTFVAHIRLLVENEVDEKNIENEKDNDVIPYTIKGNTPDSMDIFRYRVFLKKQKLGNKIVFLNAGAYNYASDFCNLPKLETIVVE
ncbi:MAG: decarboxylase [Candidatus Woesearchaeota archaeon]